MSLAYHSITTLAEIRAAEMLRIAASFLREFDPEGTAFYDGADCDAFCIADDCEAAADDIDTLAKARGEAK